MATKRNRPGEFDRSDSSAFTALPRAVASYLRHMAVLEARAPIRPLPAVARAIPPRTVFRGPPRRLDRPGRVLFRPAPKEFPSSRFNPFTSFSTRDRRYIASHGHCRDRKERKEVLFARGVAGRRGGSPGPYRRTRFSKVRC